MINEEKKVRFLDGTLKLFVVTVMYDYRGELLTKKIYNQTDDEIMKLREKLFIYGLAILRGKDHWLIIPPNKLGDIEIFSQKYFHE